MSSVDGSQGPESPSGWPKGSMLATQEPFVISQWADTLKPVAHWLIPPLADYLLDERRSLSAKGLIAKVYSVFEADLPDAYVRPEKKLTEAAELNATKDAKIALAKRQASSGAALAIMGKNEQIWSLMKHGLRLENWRLRPDRAVLTIVK